MLLLLLFSLIWVVCLTLIHDNREIKTKHVVLIMGFLLAYWGFSYTNAPDTEAYMDFFYMISSRGWVLDSLYGSQAFNMEPGTFIIMQLCKRVSESYFFFQFVILTLDVVLAYWGLKNMTNSSAQSVVFFLLYATHITFFLSAMRQGVAIALMMFCLPFFFFFKFYFYVPLLILAIFFHQSAILIFAIPIFMFLFSKTKVKWDSLQLLFLAIFVICNICYFFDISAERFVERNFGRFVYDSSLSTNREMSVENIDSPNFGVLKIIEIDICYVLFFFTNLLKKDDIFRLFGCLFLVFFILNTLVGGIIIHRLTYYLTIPYYFILFESLRSVMVKRMKMNYRVSNLIIYIYMFALFIMQAVVDNNYKFEYHMFDFIESI